MHPATLGSTPTPPIALFPPTPLTATTFGNRSKRSTGVYSISGTHQKHLLGRATSHPTDQGVRQSHGDVGHGLSTDHAGTEKVAPPQRSQATGQTHRWRAIHRRRRTRTESFVERVNQTMAAPDDASTPPLIHSFRSYRSRLFCNDPVFISLHLDRKEVEILSMFRYAVRQ